MQLEIRQRGIKITDELRAQIRRRVELALDRFAHSIERVRIYLHDVNGPRGGLGTRCRIAVEMYRRGSVVVTGLDADVLTAVAQTAGRLKLAIQRRVKQRLARRRPVRGGSLTATAGESSAA